MVEANYEQDNSLSSGSAGATGATIRANYVERSMTYYAVEKKEITFLAALNSQTLAFSSVGSFLLSLGLGTAMNRVFAEKLSPAGEVLSSIGAIILIVLSIVFYLLALNAWRLRRAEIAEILSGSATTATVKVQTGAE
jgi:hypothetical protein